VDVMLWNTARALLISRWSEFIGVIKNSFR